MLDLGEIDNSPDHCGPVMRSGTSKFVIRDAAAGRKESYRSIAICETWKDEPARLVGSAKRFNIGRPRHRQETSKPGTLANTVLHGVRNMIPIYITCPPTSAFKGRDYMRAVQKVACWREETAAAGMLIYRENSLEDQWHVAQAALTVTERLGPLLRRVISNQSSYLYPPLGIAKRIFRRWVCHWHGVEMPGLSALFSMFPNRKVILRRPWRYSGIPTDICRQRVRQDVRRARRMNKYYYLGVQNDQTEYFLPVGRILAS